MARRARSREDTRARFGRAGARRYVLVDSGVVAFDGAASAALRALAAAPPLDGATATGAARGAPSIRVELYSDILLAVGAVSGLERDAYLTLESPDAPLRAARERLWAAFARVGFGACVASGARGAAFGHLGTTREQMSMLRCEEEPFATELGLARRVHCAVASRGAGGDDALGGGGGGGGESAVAVHASASVVNCALGGVGVAGARSVLEHCEFGDGCEWRVAAGAFASGLRRLARGGGGAAGGGAAGGERGAAAVSVCAATCLQEVTLSAGGFVVLCLGVDDAVKKEAVETGTIGGGPTVCGARWERLWALGLAPADVWPPDAPSNPRAAGWLRNLWTARVFAVFDDGDGEDGRAPVEGAIRCDAEGEWRAAATWLQRLREGFAPSAAVLARWRRARRLSLKEVLAEADAGAEFAWRHALEGRIAARLREAR